MSNFDLQIKNYTISELQEIFGLSVERTGRKRAKISSKYSI